MTAWSRRSVLAALGVAPLVPACGAALGRGRRGPPPPESLAAIRVRLRELVASMQLRYPYAAALGVLRRRDRATADGTESSISHDEVACVVFTVADDRGAMRERATEDLSSDGLVRAAADLLGDDASGDAARSAPDFGEPRTLRRLGPAIARGGGGWLDRARGLYERSRRYGGSRIVYRAAFFDIEDGERLFVGAGRDLRQRIVRLRAGATFVAAAGATTYVDTAERAGTIGVRAVRIADDELESAADSALALLTARAAPTGDYDVVLDPSVCARLIADCVAPALRSGRWIAGDSAAAALRGRPVGAELVHLVDDPTLAGGYGAYGFDDEGLAAAPAALIDGGVLAGPITERAGAARLGVSPTANGRRPTPGAPAEAAPSNLVLAGGSASDRDALLAGVDDGLLLEGGLAASGDASRWSALIRIARAREVQGGKLTGRLYGPVLLHGDVPALLGAVAGATAGVEHRAAGPGTAVGGPFLLTRAAVTGA